MRVRIPVTTVALTIAAFALALSAGVDLYAVEGDSMAPTLAAGQIVVVNRLSYLLREPQMGDVVVARHPHHRDTYIVKRVVSHADSQESFLRGDNPRDSIDSRHFGSVADRGIVGRVVFVGRR